MHVSKGNMNPLQIGSAVSEVMITYAVSTEVGNEANVELTTLNNLHIFNEVFQVLFAFQKRARAKPATSVGLAIMNSFFFATLKSKPLSYMYHMIRNP